MKTWQAPLLVGLVLLVKAACAPAQYMALGHGVYGDPHLRPDARLELARFDWVYCPAGTPESTA